MSDPVKVTIALSYSSANKTCSYDIYVDDKEETSPFKANPKSKLTFTLNGAPYGLAIIGNLGANGKAADFFTDQKEGKLQARTSATPGTQYPITLICFVPNPEGYYECKSPPSPPILTAGGPKMKVEL